MSLNTLQKIMVFGLLQAPCWAVAQQCAVVDASLTINAACVNLGGALYNVQLQTNNGGIYWTLGPVNTGSSSNYCAQVDQNLNVNFPCVTYAGSYLSATLNAKADASKPLGYYWQLSAYNPIAPPTRIWKSYTHPCVENRTDAFWWDDDKTAWVGCGTGANGRGLWLSRDGGQSWGAVKGYFDTWRVNDIRRSVDGLLYVAGLDTASRDAVVSVDTKASPFSIKNVFTRTNQVDLSFQVQHFVRDSQGRGFGDSLTGYGSIYRASDTAAWQGLHTAWADDKASYQIMSMTMFNDKIYASGSTISQPPYVFLPSKQATQPYHLTPVRLSTRFTGEMWGIAVLDAQRVVAAGVDQDRDVGMIYTSKTNPYDPNDYMEFNVSGIISDKSTWMRGVCASGNTIVAVGEKQPLASGTGIVLLSNDAGKTFTNITDPKIVANSVSRCKILDNGDIAVTGAGGYVGIYQ